MAIADNPKNIFGKYWTLRYLSQRFTTPIRKLIVSYYLSFNYIEIRDLAFNISFVND